MAPLRRLRSCPGVVPVAARPGDRGTFGGVSTRGLIVAALLCGLAILGAFAVQVTLLTK